MAPFAFSTETRDATLAAAIYRSGLAAAAVDPHRQIPDLQEDRQPPARARGGRAGGLCPWPRSRPDRVRARPSNPGPRHAKGHPAGARCRWHPASRSPSISPPRSPLAVSASDKWRAASAHPGGCRKPGRPRGSWWRASRRAAGAFSGAAVVGWHKPWPAAFKRPSPCPPVRRCWSSARITRLPRPRSRRCAFWILKPSSPGARAIGLRGVG